MFKFLTMNPVKVNLVIALIALTSNYWLPAFISPISGVLLGLVLLPQVGALIGHINLMR